MKWLEVTKADGGSAVVNIAQIAYIYEGPKGTVILCSGSTGTSGLGIVAKEPYQRVIKALRDLGGNVVGVDPG